MKPFCYCISKHVMNMVSDVSNQIKPRAYSKFLGTCMCLFQIQGGDPTGTGRGKFLIKSKSSLFPQLQ